MSKKTVRSSAAQAAVRRRKRARRRATVSAAVAVLVLAVATGVWAATRDDTTTTRQVLHADTRLGTVELRVSDLGAQRAFYSDALGLQVLAESGDTVTLGADGSALVRLTRTSASPPAPSEAGLYHSAILYPDAPSLAKVLQQISTSAPQSYQGASDHVVSQAFYFNDPEGNGVELYVDRPRDTWQWDDGRVRMGNTALDPNAFITQHLGNQPAAAPTVGHVHLKVGDLDQARRFYVDTLGFELTNEADGAIFMAAGGYHHHLGANTWSSDGAGPRSTTTGLGSFQVVLPTAAEVQALAERLTSAGHAYQRTSTGLTVADPWRNVVSVVLPTAAAAGTATT